MVTVFNVSNWGCGIVAAKGSVLLGKDVMLDVTKVSGNGCADNLYPMQPIGEGDGDTSKTRVSGYASGI